VWCTGRYACVCCPSECPLACRSAVPIACVAGDATSVSALWLCAARSAAAACVCMRCAPAVCGVHALRACYVGIGPMLIRHETCASVWACAGQRHFVPRTYPGPLNPLSSPSSGPNNLGTSRAGRCWGGEKRPTHCVADRHKTRRCIAVSPNRRTAPRGPPTILTGMSPCDTPPTSQ
jgi:hypothetical protein